MKWVIVLFAAFGLYACEMQDCISRVKHMSIEREYCTTPEGISAVAEMYGNFLAGKTGHDKCKVCDCDCHAIQTDLDKCRHDIINFQGQLIDGQSGARDGRIPPNEFMPERTWKK